MRTLTYALCLLLAACSGRDVRPAVAQLRQTIADQARDLEDGTLATKTESLKRAKLARFAADLRLADEALKE